MEDRDLLAKLIEELRTYYSAAVQLIDENKESGVITNEEATDIKNQAGRLKFSGRVLELSPNDKDITNEIRQLTKGFLETNAAFSNKEFADGVRAISPAVSEKLAGLTSFGKALSLTGVDDDSSSNKGKIVTGLADAARNINTSNQDSVLPTTRRDQPAANHRVDPMTKKPTHAGNIERAAVSGGVWGGANRDWNIQGTPAKPASPAATIIESEISKAKNTTRESSQGSLNPRSLFGSSKAVFARPTFASNPDSVVPTRLTTQSITDEAVRVQKAQRDTAAATTTRWAGGNPSSNQASPASAIVNSEISKAKNTTHELSRDALNPRAPQPAFVSNQASPASAIINSEITKAKNSNDQLARDALNPRAPQPNTAAVFARPTFASNPDSVVPTRLTTQSITDEAVRVQKVERDAAAAIAATNQARDAAMAANAAATAALQQEEQRKKLEEFAKLTANWGPTEHANFAKMVASGTQSAAATKAFNGVKQNGSAQAKAAIGYAEGEASFSMPAAPVAPRSQAGGGTLRYR